jgi:hypothetical protein
MFGLTPSQAGILGLAAGLLGLLILAVLTSKRPDLDQAAPVTGFPPGWLARAPGDVERLKAARAGRSLLSLELLVNCNWECSARFCDAIARIRRGW